MLQYMHATPSIFQKDNSIKGVKGYFGLNAKSKLNCKPDCALLIYSTLGIKV